MNACIGKAFAWVCSKRDDCQLHANAKASLSKNCAAVWIADPYQECRKKKNKYFTRKGTD